MKKVLLFLLVMLSLSAFVAEGDGVQFFEGSFRQALANMYPLEGYPTIMFMDASGRVKKKVLGLPQGGAKELLGIAKGVK